MFDYLRLLKTTKKLNDEQLRLIIKEEIRNNSLNDYVNKVLISDETNYHGQYFKGELSVNPSKILNMSYSCLLSESMPIHEIYNMYSLLVIYHEINHAIQTKESLKDEEDAIHQILKEGIELGNKDFKDFTFNEKILYRLFYEKVLIERNAEIMAVSRMIKENETSDFLSKKQLEYMSSYLKHLVKRGYSKSKNPAKTYYKLRGKIEEYYELKFDEDYNLLDRLSFGLPVDYQIVKEVVEDPKMLQKLY